MVANINPLGMSQKNEPSSRATRDNGHREIRDRVANREHEGPDPQHDRRNAHETAEKD